MHAVLVKAFAVTYGAYREEFAQIRTDTNNELARRFPARGCFRKRISILRSGCEKFRELPLPPPFSS